MFFSFEKAIFASLNGKFASEHCQPKELTKREFIRVCALDGCLCRPPTVFGVLLLFFAAGASPRLTRFNIVSVIDRCFYRPA